MSSLSRSSNLAVVPLVARPQQYAWGKYGTDSEVAKVLAAAGQSIDDKKPYAELWMGTHPTAPSEIIHNEKKIPLADYIHNTLPYLFKILSIRTALSIQAHPDLTLAPKLHAENPKEYKDSNHKPEMATAITPFEAMCGFRPHTQIATYLKTVNELANVIGEDISHHYITIITSANSNDDNKKQALKQVFTALMTAKESVYKPQLHSLLNRISTSSPPLSDPNMVHPYDMNVYELITRLADQYPDDIGIFCPLLLNCFHVLPPTSIFLPANEPHAYISGDIIECMACSDNVVRAGLTPKYRDVENLTNMLTYEARPIQFIQPTNIGEQQNQQISNSNNNDNSDDNEYVRVLIPPVVEFALYCVRLNLCDHIAILPSSASHSILIIYKGSGILYAHHQPIHQPESNHNTNNNDNSLNDVGFPISAGSVYFIPAFVSVRIQNNSNSALIAFKCAENDDMKKSKL